MPLLPGSSRASIPTPAPTCIEPTNQSALRELDTKSTKRGSTNRAPLTQEVGGIPVGSQLYARPRRAQRGDEDVTSHQQRGVPPTKQHYTECQLYVGRT
eukprot:2106799-Pyramimonas_sp.AAC.1